MTADVRPAAVAGAFYPHEPSELQSLVASCLGDDLGSRRPVRAAVVPHAGLVYSGRCAGAVFSRVQIPEVVVIVAPNHTGLLGAPGGASLWDRGAFETPLGRVPIARAFAERLIARCDLVARDPAAHAREHAIEVELPFLRLLSPTVHIVPLVLAWDDWPRCLTLGAAVADVTSAWSGKVLLLASSDMTHHEPAAAAARKDRLALAAVERLDGEGLLALCRSEHITMCGRAPAAVVVEAARRLGAVSGEVVDYRHSGWVTGDDTGVVAYAGVVIA